ncbi:MAG: single-stranded-DNA-specific exonuclease RecJ [Bacillota bacterium]
MNVKIHELANKKIPKWLLNEVEGNKLIANLLLQRGIDNKEKLLEFIDPDNYTATKTENFKNMNNAVNRIIKAIKLNKNILIYGDYDVDGITATTILLLYLKSLGANVSYHIPDRFKEGYGMNKKVIKDKAKSTDLILSCDCGISNYEEIKLAKKLNLEVIVTDHHDLPEKLPPADEILTPKFFNEDHKAKSLVGAGMAYYFVKGIENHIEKNNLNIKSQLKSENFLDLLSLAIVADVVPLKGENRYLLQRGLKKIKNTNRKALVKLIELSGISQSIISEEDIAFRLAPIINAAGRMENGSIAVELFSSNEKEKIEKKAKKMIKINQRRKDLQKEMIEEAELMIHEENIDPENKKVIILYQPHWHEGILGIGAGRLSEKYNVPVLLMSLKNDEKTVTGSARSIEGININHFLKKVKKFLIKAGGHAGAAGFSLKRDKVMLFKKNLETLLNKKLSNMSIKNEIKVNAEIKLNNIDINSYYKLRILAPFGEENPKPLFISKDCSVLQERNFSENKHKRLLLEQKNSKQTAIWWWGGDEELNNNMDIIYTLDINRFQGKENLQLNIKNIINSKKMKLNNKREKYSFLEELKIIDLRNSNVNSKIEEIEKKDLAYYLEGEKKKKYTPVITRYDIKNCDSLVLLTIPPSLSILKDLVYNNEPKKLVLAFNKSKLSENKSFLNNFLALIKYVITNKNGKFNISEISVQLGELEETVELALKYIEAAGYIYLEKINENNFFISKNSNGNKEKKIKYKKNLRELLKESYSFKKFLLKVESEKILNYIINSN